MLRFEQLRIARGSRTLLDGIDLAFAPGSVVALLGANGAGKSTLLATAAGLHPPAQGRVLIDGTPLAALAPRERAQRIALVDPAESVLVSLTVRDAVATARYPYHAWWSWVPTASDADAVDAALHRTELTGLADREVGTLSSGERQRVWIAVALAQRARVLLLDEPTSHLDLRHAVATLELVRGLADDGATVVAVLHHLEEAASFADRVVVLGDGGIVADGTPAEALTPDTIARAFEAAVDVDERDGHLIFYRRPSPASGAEAAAPKRPE